MKRSGILAPLFLILIAAFFWGREPRLVERKHTKSNNVAQPAAATTPSASTPTGAEPSTVTGSPQAPATTASGATALPQNEKESLKAMSLVLLNAAKGKDNLEGLVDKLKRSGQDPVITRSGDSPTGELVIVRTKSPLPGTRYFHAQFFTDENNQRFVQHMSFEFKPGPTSMNEAVQAAMQSFGVTKPSQKSGDFIQWDLDDNYVLWIKKKSAKDLKNDAFNAYDPKKDVGSVQMTVEIKIHDEEEAGHAH